MKNFAETANIAIFHSDMQISRYQDDHDKHLYWNVDNAFTFDTRFMIFVIFVLLQKMLLFKLITNRNTYI
jgi:hypothetical protein